jgi:hypothetical protein
MDMVRNVTVSDCEFVTAHDSAIHLEHGLGVTVRGSYFTENATYESVASRTHTRVGITLLGASRNVIVKECVFERVFNGVQIAGSGEGTARSVKVTNCEFSGLKGWGGVNADCGGENIHIALCGVENKQVSHYTDGNPPPMEDNAGMRFRASHDVHITNVTFDGCPLGIRAEAFEDIKVNHCSFADVGVGIFVDVGDTAIETSHLNVSHCHFHRLSVSANMNIDVSAAVYVYPNDDTVDVSDFNLVHNDIEGISAGGFYFRNCDHIHNLRITDNTFDDNADISGAPPIVWLDVTTFDAQVENNMARNIGGSTDIEREIGTVTHNRLRRRENATVGCDEYWDNDGVISETRVSFVDNAGNVGALNPQRIRECWGGMVFVGDSATDGTTGWSFTNDQLGVGHFILRLYNTADSRIDSLNVEIDAAYEWDPSTATWTLNSPSWGEIVVQGKDISDIAGSGNCSRNWLMDATPAIDGTLRWLSSRSDVTLIDGQVNHVPAFAALDSLYFGSGFNANNRLFRVTRVGWTARTDTSPAQMDDFYCQFRYVTHSSGTSGALVPYTAIDLSTNLTETQLTRQRYQMFKDVDIVIDGRQGEFIYAEYYAESSANQQWDDIELYIQFEADFRLSDVIQDL